MKAFKNILPYFLLALLTIQNISYRHQIRSWKSACADWKTASETWKATAERHANNSDANLKLAKEFATTLETANKFIKVLQSDLKFYSDSTSLLIEELRKK